MAVRADDVGRRGASPAAPDAAGVSPVSAGLVSTAPNAAGTLVGSVKELVVGMAFLGPPASACVAA